MASCTLRLGSLLTLLSTIALGCGGEADHPPVIDGTGTGTGSGAPADEIKTELKTGTCAPDGDTAACVVNTGRTGNIVNCFHGTQTCRDGAWSGCEASVPAQ